jgi:hypothetical protein
MLPLVINVYIVYLLCNVKHIDLMFSLLLQQSNNSQTLQYC